SLGCLSAPAGLDSARFSEKRGRARRGTMGRKLVVTGVAVLSVGAAVAIASANVSSGPSPDRPAFAPEDDGSYLASRDAYNSALHGAPPGVAVDPASRLRAVAVLQRQEAQLAKTTNSPTTWTELGPAPVPNGQTQTISDAVSGRVTAIAVDPTDSNVAYLGAADGG